MVNSANGSKVDVSGRMAAESSTGSKARWFKATNELLKVHTGQHPDRIHLRKMNGLLTL